MRGGQLVRQWTLLVTLRSGQFTLAQLAAALGCSPRTVRRDLAVLESIHFPIQSWRINNDGAMDAGASVYWSIQAMKEWPRRETTPIARLPQ